jgi:hypothetical protein
LALVIAAVVIVAAVRHVVAAACAIAIGIAAIVHDECNGMPSPFSFYSLSFLIQPAPGMIEKSTVETTSFTPSFDALDDCCSADFPSPSLLCLSSLPSCIHIDSTLPSPFGCLPATHCVAKRLSKKI